MLGQKGFNRPPYFCSVVCLHRLFYGYMYNFLYFFGQFGTNERGRPTTSLFSLTASSFFSIDTQCLCFKSSLIHSIYSIFVCYFSVLGYLLAKWHTQWRNRFYRLNSKSFFWILNPKKRYFFPKLTKYSIFWNYSNLKNCHVADFQYLTVLAHFSQYLK